MNSFLDDAGRFVIDWLMNIGLSHHYAILLRGIIIFLLVIISSIVANFIAKRIIISINSRIVKSTNNVWNKVLFKKKVFYKLSHFVSALIFYFSAHITLKYYPSYKILVQSASFIYMIIAGMVVTLSFINVSHSLYLQLSDAKSRPIKGYVQLVKIIIYFVSSILILSILIGKSPMTLLAGFGALAAVLLIVFKDSINAFSSSIQLSSNHMLKPGDKMIMPKYNIDGEVMEISMNIVKVKNSDNTIATISTNTLMAEPFTNFKGIYESGSRLIKRSFFIDLKTIHFLDKDELLKLKQNKFIPFEKISESIENAEETPKTNLSLFRNYIEYYLKNSTSIHQGYKFIIHHLQPTDKGVPVEICAYCTITKDEEYELFVSEITEHILAIVSEFELKIFQSPSPEQYHSHSLHE